jgi:hypothetical protein
LRYAPSGVLVGGTRRRHFDGTNFKPHKLPENAPTPTTLAPAHFAGDRVHAVLGAFELQRRSGFAGTFFDCELRMRDYIRNDLYNKKNKQNDPVWNGIISPSHYHKSIIHRDVERDIWCQLLPIHCLSERNLQNPVI